MHPRKAEELAKSEAKHRGRFTPPRRPDGCTSGASVLGIAAIMVAMVLASECQGDRADEQSARNSDARAVSLHRVASPPTP